MRDPRNMSLYLAPSFNTAGQDHRWQVGITTQSDMKNIALGQY